MFDCNIEKKTPLLSHFFEIVLSSSLYDNKISKNAFFLTHPKKIYFVKEKFSLGTRKQRAILEFEKGRSY